MTINLRDKTTARLLGSTFALALAASPLSLAFDHHGLHVGAHAAFAKDGSSGSGSSGSGGGSGSGGSSSGSGSGGSGSDHDSDGGDHSGPGRGGDGGGDDGGRGGNDDGPNHDAGDDNGRHGAEHIGRNGVKIEINGNNVEAVCQRHQGRGRERLHELKDAAGRTIVERRATQPTSRGSPASRDRRAGSAPGRPRPRHACQRRSAAVQHRRRGSTPSLATRVI